MEVILASGSPRRAALLRQMGLRDFAVLPADIREAVPPGTKPGEAVALLSAQKAQAVAASHPQALILAADTVVALEGAILGKPQDRGEAAAMLRALSGKTHEVYTGLTLRRGEKVRSHVEVTAVTFRVLTEAEIAGYVSTSEPLDKAGGYGIQGAAGVFVSRLQGDYFNVMGLPICALSLLLREFGLTFPYGGTPAQEDAP